MFQYFLHVSYIGTNFFGWQIQVHLRTVQGELWSALRIIDCTADIPYGTSRTDAGVHANYQGVLVRTNKEWNPYRLLTAINAQLRHDVKVLSVSYVSKEFCPRRHVVAKRYIYKIQEGFVKDPFNHKRRWHIFGSTFLDCKSILLAISFLMGTHDFSSFRHSECSSFNLNKTIYLIDVKHKSNNCFDIEIIGDSFLMHMVRIIVGTLIDVGKGYIKASDVAIILKQKKRQMAGATAPAHGLYLDYIWYEDRWGINDRKNYSISEKNYPPLIK